MPSSASTSATWRTWRRWSTSRQPSPSTSGCSGHGPTVVAYDLHPDYLATRYALERAGARWPAGVGVQHHHAHIAACLADNAGRLDGGPVIGVCFDGTGYGPDGRSLGRRVPGRATTGTATRAAHLEYLPLPGGDAAVRNPYRWPGLPARRCLAKRSPDAAPSRPAVDARMEVDVIRRQVERGLNTPLTSSAGPALRRRRGAAGRAARASSYEAQAAIELEMRHGRPRTGEPGMPPYPFDFLTTRGRGCVVELRPAFRGPSGRPGAAAGPSEQIAWRSTSPWPDDRRSLPRRWPGDGP